MLTKLMSGGQTGADQAALDFAIENDIPYSGWIPKGRMTESGPLPEKYHLEEMPTKSYPKRTEKNIIVSDGTLIVSHGTITGGTALTKKLAKTSKRGRATLID
jgi:Circularly permutated YpsA SLOG family